MSGVDASDPHADVLSIVISHKATSAIKQTEATMARSCGTTRLSTQNGLEVACGDPVGLVTVSGVDARSLGLRLTSERFFGLLGTQTLSV